MTRCRLTILVGGVFVRTAGRSSIDTFGWGKYNPFRIF